MSLPKKTDNREMVFQFISQPSDVNFGGHVHGGMVMKWIDLAAYSLASAWSGSYAVTVYVGGIQFICPIDIGDLVEVQCQIVHTRNSSMHISVDVYRRCPREQQREKATHCIIIFVAVDEEGNKVKVPKWTPVTEQDIALEQHAIKLMELRRAVDEEMKAYFQD